MLKFVKIWTDESLRGSIRKDMSPAQRSIWYELLLLAGKSRREGYLEYSQGIPYTEADIARTLEVEESLVTESINICVGEGRLEIVDGKTYHITHWDAYQRTEEQRKAVYKARVERKAKSNEAHRIVTEAQALSCARDNPEVFKAAVDAELKRRAELDAKELGRNNDAKAFDKLYDRASNLNPNPKGCN